MMQRVFLEQIIKKPITGEWGAEGNSVKVLRTTNFTNHGELNLKNIVLRSISDDKIRKKKLLKGDIIIEKSGGSPKQPVGRVVFFDEEGTFLCNNFTSILRPKSDLVFSRYLHYQLFAAHKFGVTGMFQNKTTGIINLQLPRYISTLEIPLPDLPTQKRIASILDDAQALKQKTEKLLAEYDELAQSIFLDMFGDPVTNPKGWEIVKLSTICNKITDGTHQGPNFIDNGIPFLLVSNINNNEINFSTKKYVSEEEYHNLTKSTPIERGDLLYTSVGSYGNPAIVNDNRKFCFQRHIAHLKPNHALVNIKFLHSMMSSPLVRRQADRYAVGVAQKTLNLKTIKAFDVFLPPIDIQNEFTSKIELIEQQKALAKQELKESEDLFNCLLQKAFKGELV